MSVGCLEVKLQVVDSSDWWQDMFDYHPKNLVDGCVAAQGAKYGCCFHSKAGVAKPYVTLGMKLTHVSKVNILLRDEIDPNVDSKNDTQLA